MLACTFRPLRPPSLAGPCQAASAAQAADPSPVRQAQPEHTDIATLLIPDITAADAGFYLCVATSPAGTAQARIEVVVLSGAGPLGAEGGRRASQGSLRPAHSPLPTAAGTISLPVRIESSSPSVAEGQTLDLNCVVTGLAHTQVTWYKRGGSLPAHTQVRGSQSLWRGPWAWVCAQVEASHSPGTPCEPGRPFAFPPVRRGAAQRGQ